MRSTIKDLEDKRIELELNFENLALNLKYEQSYFNIDSFVKESIMLKFKGRNIRKWSKNKLNLDLKWNDLRS